MTLPSVSTSAINSRAVGAIDSCTPVGMSTAVDPLKKLECFGFGGYASTDQLIQALAEKFPNAFACQAFPVRPEQLADRLLSTVRFVDDGFADDRAAAVKHLFGNIATSITQGEMALAEGAFKKLLDQNNQADDQGVRPLDAMLNSLGLPYHGATKDNGKQMGHACEMASDVSALCKAPYKSLGEGIAYLHDHGQIIEGRPGVGVGNLRYPAANEVGTAALMAELAHGLTDDERACMHKVALAVNAAGTYFSLMKLEDGGFFLGTVVERMAKEGTLANLLDNAKDPEAAKALLALTCFTSVADTGRHVLKGVARPSHEEIEQRAPRFLKLLGECAQAPDTSASFKAQFFETSGEGTWVLNQRGCALAQKMAKAIDVFGEFPVDSMAVNGGKGNPLSIECAHDWNEGDRAAVLSGLGGNGAFGAKSVEELIPGTLIASIPDLASLHDASLFEPGEDSKTCYAQAFKAMAGFIGRHVDYQQPQALRNLMQEIQRVGGASR
ncbi:hypothetical protein P5705_14130 [Pseudomonas entomophila]|uniref:hypothetical protein n=1 Tax=Pseudomonas entomophila TaxID=312306 RepID=UPI00240644A3|nr:hypothetical protein [Pseudomonas entomophila]MDF9618786.1 hypothetical protein [Pseudomonas entomophila]